MARSHGHTGEGGGSTAIEEGERRGSSTAGVGPDAKPFEKKIHIKNGFFCLHGMDDVTVRWRCGSPFGHIGKGR